MRGLTVIVMMASTSLVLGLIQTGMSLVLCPEYVEVRWSTMLVEAIVLGMIIGIPLAFAARAGRRIKRRPGSLRRPLLIWLILTGLGTLAGGVLAWNLAAGGGLTLSEPLATRVPAERHAIFIALDLSNGARLLIGGAVGAVMILLVWRSREYGTGPHFER